MTSFRAAQGVGEGWSDALAGCLNKLGGSAGGENFGFVYVTEAVAANLADILETLSANTGIANWVGSVGLGVCGLGALGSNGDIVGREYYEEAAIAVMTVALPEGSFRLLADMDLGAKGAAPEDQAWIDAAGPTFGLVHADCSDPDIAQRVEALAAANPAFMVGGLTMSREVKHQIAGQPTGGGLSGVMFAPEIEVATALTQGCQPIGETHIVSDCMDNVVVALDGRPALEVFAEDIGDVLARDFSRVAGYIHAALPVAGSDTGDYVVRNLIGVDEERAWVAIGAPLTIGDRIMFVRRDPAAARADLTAMLERLTRRIGVKPKGALYVSCIARGPGMFGAKGEEMSIIGDRLGDVPLVGFYANGEISLNRLYSYTGVLTLFL